ncbi:ABC transporter permease subunit [Paenibacillus lupini]|uniref:ABC transporter permease n=1 Tax=Paenibacillus lupini TaxID=1450204 RepID=UPI001FBA926D|nr:ABC transporter permease subunit [Paenibacillus lupini]NIK25049.1 putative aldouronate transport system permease protein [Paenibacillus lupini]
MSRRNWRLELPLHLMLVPGIIIVLLFSYGPMVGIVIAFENFIPVKGIFHSKWVGLDHFRYIYNLSETRVVLRNTVFIAFMKIIGGLFAPLVTALLLNEIRKKFYKRSVQTIIYMPHFMSWVIMAGILIDVLSPTSGIVNQFIEWLGFDKVFFLGDDKWFPYVLAVTDVLKEFGFGTVVYLAAITAVNPSLYEAAVLDGANRWKQTLHVTIPAIIPITILLTTLALGNVLNAGFDQVFNLYNPSVYSTGDILDTYVYRIGLASAQYGVATAVGLFKSVISLVLIALSYFLAYRFANYRIF